MQMIANPAVALRARVTEDSLPGFLRWDATGRALLVSDAPRRADGEGTLLSFQEKRKKQRKASWGEGDVITACGGICFIDRRLLYIDLTPEEYERFALEIFSFFSPRMITGLWVSCYFSTQSLLSGILFRDFAQSSEPVDVPLLRRAMIACARGGAAFADFVDALAALDAAALRKGDTRAVRACAALCAQYFYTQRGIGLPERIASLSFISDI